MQRQRYSNDFKDQIVKESLEVGNSTIVARKHDLSPNLVNRWVRNFKSQTNPFRSEINVRFPGLKDIKSLETENERLKRMIGEKDLEIEILRDLLKKNNQPSRTK